MQLMVIPYFLITFILSFSLGNDETPSLLQSIQNSLPPCSSFHYLSEVRVERKTRNVLDEDQNKKLATFMKMHENCSRSSWYCYPQCRIRPSNTSKSRCSQPAPGAKCFGINITYLYVPPDPNIVPLLPRYEVLSRFPRCWTVLAPLMCGVAYRPCTVRYGMQSYQKDVEKLELWQLFRWSMCDRALTECTFLIDWGLWPDFINCTKKPLDKADNSRLYADRSCQMNYKEPPANFERLQCLWPLIKSEEHFRDTEPLIDDCYLPCHSTLVSSASTRSDFKTKILIISALVSFVLLLCSVYLSALSEVWKTNICAYILGHTSFSGCLYYFFWVLSYFDWFAESAMCFDNGDLRRTNNSTLGKAIGWCGLQSFLMHVMFFSGYFWFCTFFVFCIGQPRVRTDHRIMIDGRPDWSLRCVLLVLYFIAAVAALPPFWSSKAENDGLLGICYVGLLTSSDRIWIFLPILCATGLAFFMTVMILLSRRGNKKTEVVGGKSKSSGSDAEQSAVSNFSEMRVLVSTNIESRNESRKEGIGGDDSVDDGFASGQISETPENDELILKESHTVHPFEQAIIAKSGYGCSSAISPLFAGAILLLYVFSLLLSLVIHVKSDWSPEIEKELILKSQRCSLNATILEGKTEWFNEARHSDHLISSVDPLVRKKQIGTGFLNAPGCDITPVLDDYFYALLLMHIVFPSLPFFAIGLLLITGFCGIGFKGIEKIREHINPFVRTTTTTDSEIQETCGSDYVGLGELGNYSSRRSLTSWCDNHHQPRHPCSSADCLNKSHLSSTDSMSSQINSEPVKSETSRSHVRKLDLKRLAQHRTQNIRKNSISLQSTSGSSYPEKERLNMLSSQQCSVASLTSEVPSVYSHEFPSCLGGCNTSGISHRGYSNMEAATVLSAYQTGLVEGFWQQMCREYSDKINTLVGCLQQAEVEIRRLSGQEPATASSNVPFAPSAFDAMGFHSRNGFPFVGLSLLQASGLTPNYQNNPQPLRPCSSDTVSEQSCHNSHLNPSGNPAKKPFTLNEEESSKDVQNPNAMNAATNSHNKDLSCAADEILSKTPCRPEGNVVNEASDGPGSNDDRNSVASENASSNSFLSDEEDEEEEKIWQQKSVEMSRSGSSVPLTMKTEKENEHASESGDSKYRINCPHIWNNESNSSSQLYILPSLKPPTSSHSRINGNSGFHGSIANHNTQPVPNSSLPSSSHQLPNSSRAALGDRNMLLGNSHPITVVATRSGEEPGVSRPNGNVSSGASVVRPVLLTEEQARGLLNLRSQLTGSDLLFYSNRLREEAMRRLGNQGVAAASNSRRINPSHSNRQAEPIREEEEEVPDPFSSSDSTSANPSHPGSRSFSNNKTNNDRDEGAGNSGV